MAAGMMTRTAVVAAAPAVTSQRSSVKSLGARAALPARRVSLHSTRRCAVVMSSDQQKTPDEFDVLARVPAPLLAGMVTLATVAPEADASVTPSLKNLLLSVVSGGILLAVIAVAIIGVSSFDTVNRK